MRSVANSKKIKSGKRTFYLPDEEQSKLYDNVKFELKKKYNIKSNSRDAVIKSLISQLTHGDYHNYSIPKINLFIYRTDIKNFFPSINKHQLYRRLNNSAVLSNESLNVLKEALFSKKVEGVPLGLQFSNHLAEFYLENFDLEIKHTLQPLAYFRYVDDILIIQYDFTKTKKDRKNYLKAFEEVIDGIFKSQSLARNVEKTSSSFYNATQPNSEFSFDYLGYQFTSNKSSLEIGISDAKIKKYIKRINSYFYHYKTGYKSNKDFWKLYYKLKNVLQGVTAYNSKRNIFKFGIGYNYRFINHNDSIMVLINKFKENVHSCKLSSYKKNTLLELVKFDPINQEPKHLLLKRYNYLKITSVQQKLLEKQINMPPVAKHNDFPNKFFYHLYN